MDINPGQILSLVLATVPTMLAVLIGILINNSRLTDLRSHMDSRFDEMRATWHNGSGRRRSGPATKRENQ